MEKVVKILLNSLYGKFGQKFKDKDNLIPFDHTPEELERLPRWEFVGKECLYIRITEDRIPPAFCIPIWACYVTAYGRIKLHKAIKYAKPLYVDTDSLITRKEFKNSLELGELKLEEYIKKGIIVKPKFYGLITETKKKAKIKGIGMKLVFADFERILLEKKAVYNKFLKVREALRRGLIPNEIVSITKHLNLNDDKRIWDGDFNPNELQFSTPISTIIFEGVTMTETQRDELLLKSKLKYEKEIEIETDKFLNSDLFDSFSVGKDISNKEFLENEKDWRSD